MLDAEHVLRASEAGQLAGEALRSELLPVDVTHLCLPSLPFLPAQLLVENPQQEVRSGFDLDH